jgi:hypothetical protein
MIGSQNPNSRACRACELWISAAATYKFKRLDLVGNCCIKYGYYALNGMKGKNWCEGLVGNWQRDLQEICRDLIGQALQSDWLTSASKRLSCKAVMLSTMIGWTILALTSHRG